MIISILVLWPVLAAAQAPAPTVVYAINAGGPSVGEFSGDTYWQKPGRTYTSNITVSGTSTPDVYRTERYGDMSYAFPVAPGPYTVQLLFAEVFRKAAGERIFHVELEGQRVLEHFDIFAEAGGFAKALVRSLDIQVTDGTLNLDFVRQQDAPKINGIVILATAPVQLPVLTLDHGIQWKPPTVMADGTPLKGLMGYHIYLTQTRGQYGEPVRRVTNPIHLWRDTPGRIAHGVWHVRVTALSEGKDAQGAVRAHESQPSEEFTFVLVGETTGDPTVAPSGVDVSPKAP